MECPSCHSETPDDSKFCDVCGAAFPGCCPSCGATNRTGARFCAKCGHTLAADTPVAPTKSVTAARVSQATEPATSGERRQVTIMFCDLVGSTTLSAWLDPEDMREVIGAYHHCCAEVIAKSGGFVAKYMGDGVLAYFGYPEAHEDDAEWAVRSALSLTEAVPSLPTDHRAALQVRVGIATGVVVVGDLIGEGAAQEQGVVGETPNLAARLQSLAAPGRVVISQSTRHLAGGLFEYRDIGRIGAKGLADPVQAWEVLGPSALESRFEAYHQTGLTPLVGREEELELLLRRWRQAVNGEGRVVLLSGEPGIGKSRLTVALQERLEGEPRTRLRRFCSPHHTDSAFYPTITQLERAAGFERHDTPDTKLDKLKSLLGSVPDEDGQLLAELLSIPTSERYAPLNMSPQRKKEKTFEALLRQLEMLTRQRPVLVVYEDVQWIDPSSSELLDMTIERVARLPVLLLITFRPDFEPPWTGQAHVTTLNLSRLARREGLVLVERVAGNSELPDAITAEIVERADGVPLFVEELTKAVLEAGSRHGDAERAVSAAPMPSLAVPATLHASLIARLDRLGPVVKEIAQIAAAIGREVPYGLIAPVAQRREAELRAALERLNDAGLWSHRGTPPQATYLFKHTLVRDAAYGTLLRARRQELHARISTVLEERFAEIVAQQPELLAHHCTEAGSTEKAAVYWRRAGQKSAARSAMVEAVVQLRRGLSLVATLPENPQRWQQELELQSALGAALSASKGLTAPETGQAYARARALCEQLDDTVAMVPVLSGQSIYHIQRCEFTLARQIGEDLLRAAERRDDPATYLVGHRIIGACSYWVGEFETCLEHLRRVLALYVPRTHQSLASIAGFDVRAAALSYLLLDLFVLGFPDQACSLRDKSLAWSRNLHHPHSLALALHWVAVFDLHRRAQQALLEVLEEQISVTTEQKLPLWLAHAKVMRGYALSALGNTAEGLALARQGYAETAATAPIVSQTRQLGFLAEICEMRGLIEEAFDLLARVLHTAEQTGLRYYDAELHRLRGEWLLAHRRTEQAAAAASFRRSLAIARQQNARMWELRAAASLARLWRDQGERTQARDLLTPIYSWFTEGFDTPDLKEAKALLEELTC